jgi:hypothetical protein
MEEEVNLHREGCIRCCGEHMANKILCAFQNLLSGAIKGNFCQPSI